MKNRRGRLNGKAATQPKQSWSGFGMSCEGNSSHDVSKKDIRFRSLMPEVTGRDCGSTSVFAPVSISRTA